MTGKEQTPDISWLTESVRFTGFLAGSTPSQASDWWVSLVGSPAESTVSRTDIRLQQQEGPLGPGRLVLVLLPGRVDWHLSVSPKATESESVPSLGSFEEAVNLFRPVLRKWFEICPPLSRVAVGSVLIQPVPDRVEGYRRLAHFLKDSVRLDPENSSEFSYSINRPRISKKTEGGLVLNRLSKWTVSASQSVQITVGLGNTQTRTLNTRHACRLEVDLSTPAGLEGNLPSAQIPLIFDELIEFADEISLRGDLP
jgi:hypothetical protein